MNSTIDDKIILFCQEESNEEGMPSLRRPVPSRHKWCFVFAEQRLDMNALASEILFSRAPLHCVPASQKRASTPNTRKPRVLGGPGLMGAAAREPAAQGIVLAAACTARLRSPRSPSASSGSLRA